MTLFFSLSLLAEKRPLFRGRFKSNNNDDDCLVVAYEEWNDDAFFRIDEETKKMIKKNRIKKRGKGREETPSSVA
jgi:hypothetical protein